MENSLKPIYGFWITASVLIGIGAIASLATGKGDFLIWLAHHRNLFLDYYFYYITRLAEPVGFIIVGLLFLISSWKKMVLVPVLGLLSTLITRAMKSIFQHERPALFLKKMDWIGPTDVLDYHMLIGHTSFPSGHSMAAWSLFSLVAMMYRKAWVSALCIFLAVFGFHFPYIPHGALPGRCSLWCQPWLFNGLRDVSCIPPLDEAKVLNLLLQYQCYLCCLTQNSYDHSTFIYSRGSFYRAPVFLWQALWQFVNNRRYHGIENCFCQWRFHPAQIRTVPEAG
jgi:hypothetical protein